MKNSLVILLTSFILANACSKTKTTQTQMTDSLTQDTIQTEVSQSNIKTIVCFGNSLTAGYGLDEQESYPALIQRKIDSLQMPYQVVNAGLSGETSAGGNSRIDWVLNQPMDVFILELGANDALRGLDVQATLENLRGILQKVRSKYPAIPIIIAGMLAPPNLGQEYTQAFALNYKTLATEFQAGLIPFLNNVAAIPELNQADGIHPNAVGTRIVADNVWAVLNTYL